MKTKILLLVLALLLSACANTRKTRGQGKQKDSLEVRRARSSKHWSNY